MATPGARARALRPDPTSTRQSSGEVRPPGAGAAANPQAADKYTEAGAALTQAQQIIQQAEPALANHPLLAHIHERHAWILMDQWNVLGASQEFEQARNIRFDNYWKSKNEFAQIFAFHNAHGLAMAERYCGDARIAPTGAAKVSISGSGDVELATRPSTLSQTLTGSGGVHQN